MLIEIKPIEILQGIFALGLGVWIPKKKLLAIADLHIGYEEALNAEGILVPRQQFKLTKELLERMLAEVKPKIIVINGDLKHEFGGISKQEWRETLAIFDLLSNHSKKIVLIKGNHDTILEPLAKKRNLKIKDFYCIEDICITHGHKILAEKEFQAAKILIIANEHPAISIREGVKSELYKCFLLGKWKSKKLIVMPSFLPIIEGTDVRKERILSPYLQQSLANFEVFAVGDKVYRFGKLKNIR